VTLTDAGPLVALADRGDSAHQWCYDAAEQLRPPLITTWPALTEAMHLIYRKGGWAGQAQLWSRIQQGVIEIAAPGINTLERCRELMVRYRDVPMDLADASLLALAEERGFNTIFSIDGYFNIFRMKNRRVLRPVPGPLPRS